MPLIGEAGRLRSRVDEEKARRGALQQQRVALEQAIRLEVVTARSRDASARQQLRAAAKSVEHAVESLRIEQEKYELGRGTTVDVLDAQTALLSAQIGRLQALVDLHTALALWKFALGEDMP